MSAVLSFARPTASMPDRVLAFVTDEATAAVVNQAVPGATVREDGLGGAIGALSQGASAAAVIVDVTGSEDPVSGLQTLLRIAGARCRIVVIGTVNDITLYRTLREAGAVDYLIKPVQPSVLAAAISRIGEEPVPKPSGDRELRRLFVCGARGGAGATTVAVNMAWHLSRRKNFRIALIDLDLALGTVALALDLEPSHGLRDILDDPDRVDALFVTSAAIRVDDTLSVFAAEEALENAIIASSQTEAALPRLFDTLADSTDCIIVDVPRAVAVAQPGIFAHADALVIVAECNLAAARDAARLTALAHDAAPDCVLTLIANKCGKGKGEIDKANFARGARLDVQHMLPWDDKAAAAAANAGQPIEQVASSSSLAKAIAAAADALVPPTASSGTKSLWKRVLGRS